MLHSHPRGGCLESKRMDFLGCPHVLSPCLAGTGPQPCHVAQEIAALCSFAFILRAAMLEVLRSGSLFSS